MSKKLVEVMLNLEEAVVLEEVKLSTWTLRVPTEKHIEAIKQYMPKVVGIPYLLNTYFDNMEAQ
jgi:hypothetical protein